MPDEPRQSEQRALIDVEAAARQYARFTHGNLSGRRYLEREEARDALLDALARLDVIRERKAA